MINDERNGKKEININEMYMNNNEK